MNRHQHHHLFIVLLTAILLSSPLNAVARKSKSITLTQAEKNWIRAHPVIRCAPDPDFPPAEFFDETGQYKGLVADYIDIIFRRVGLEKEIVRLKSWEDVLQHAREKKIDLVTAASKTPQRSEFLNFTEPYIELAAVIIVRQQVKQELTLDQLAGMKVAVGREYASHDFLAKNFPYLDLDPVNNILTGLRKVSFGMADAMVANIATVSINIEKGTIANLKVAGESGFKYRLSFAPIKEHTVLTGILDKGLASMTTEEKRQIYNKWIRLEQPPLLGKTFFLLVSLITGFTLLVVTGVVLWNRSLKKVVTQKTSALKMEIRNHEQAKQKIAESESRYRGIFESTKSGVIVYRVDKNEESFVAIDANKFVRNIDKLEPDEIIGKDIVQIFPAIQEFGLLAVIQQVWQTGRPAHFPSSFYHDSRIQGWRDYFVYKLPSNEIVTVYSDETSRITAERALRQSEEKLSAIIDSINDHMVMLDDTLTILWANHTAKTTFGEQIENRKCYTIFAGLNQPCPDCIAKKSFISSNMHEREFAVKQNNSDNFDFWESTNAASFDKHNKPATVVTIFRDITKRKALAAEAMRAGHLASIGELAAGVAHEINNPINSIINLGQLIANDSEKNYGFHDLANRIMNEGKRIAGIVSSLLTFARETTGPAVPLSVKEILDETLALTKTQLDKQGISFELDFPPGLPRIQCHMQKIQQVFLNLINNARDALNQKAQVERYEKVLKISGTKKKVDGRTFVRIVFEDNGQGISPSHLDSVMDPFFSTKPSGKGTGLGLSISHGIVSNHGGNMEISSKEHYFTKVVLDLPGEES